MVAYLKSHDLLDVSFGAGKESYEDENDCLDDGGISYAIICMAMNNNICYLMEYVEYPLELWRNIHRAFGVQKEENDRWRESKTSSFVLPSKLSASILSYEVVQDEEEA